MPRTITTSGPAPAFALAVALVALTLGLAGCRQTGPNTVERDPDVGFDNPYPRVTYQMGLTESEIVYDRPSVRRAEGNRPLEVTVPLRSLKDEQIAIQYQFVFYDEQGQLVRPAADWRRAVVPGRSVLYVTSNATSLAGDDWRLLLRKSRTEGR